MKQINLRLLKISLLSFLSVAFLSTLAAKADVIELTAAGNNLISTGLDVVDLTPIVGDPTGVDNPVDPSYTVDYYAIKKGNPLAVLNIAALGKPTISGPAYVADPPAVGWVSSADSGWITYMANMNNVHKTPLTGATLYQLDLSDIPVGDEVTIDSSIASDDNVTVYANNNEVFSNFSATDNGYNNRDNYEEFSTVDFSFLSGTSNTLDFLVINNGGFATGLDAQLSGFYVVPEPSTEALMLAAFAGLVFYQRRNKLAVQKL